MATGPILAVLKILALVSVGLVVIFAVTHHPFLTIAAGVCASWCGWTHLKVRSNRNR
jgi:hypothetical protein